MGHCLQMTDSSRTTEERDDLVMASRALGPELGKRSVDWLDELRLEPGPPFLAMGTRALDLAKWLVADDEREREIAEKRALIDRDRSAVFGAIGGSEEPCSEVLELISMWTGRTAEGVEHPLIEASLMVQDDLAVMQRIDDEWVLAAGVVCFPSHWSLPDKLGLPLDLVHSPVTHYEHELRQKVDRFHDRLPLDRPAWRRNWSVNATNELHAPVRWNDPAPPDVLAADGSPMWIRSERQTLRRLQRSDAILFTIRVQLAPLGVLRSRPDLAAKMLQAVRSWDEPKRRYNSTAGALPQLMQWLESVIAAS